MNVEDRDEERLFSYGTLQSEAVQIATFGRKLDARPDVLSKYRLGMIRISDEEFALQNGSAEQRNLELTGNDADFVEGTVLTLTVNELQQADAYEPEEYRRVTVQLRSGTRAWVYIAHQR